MIIPLRSAWEQRHGLIGEVLMTPCTVLFNGNAEENNMHIWIVFCNEMTVFSEPISLFAPV